VHDFFVAEEAIYSATLTLEDGGHSALTTLNHGELQRMAESKNVVDESPRSAPAEAESNVRNRLGIAFSGGGFRATLFHLGVLLFLLKNRLLNATTTVVGVSGGAILAAHLGCHWETFTNDVDGKPFIDNSNRRACVAKLLAFIRMDLRNRVFRRCAMFFAYGIALAIAVSVGSRSWHVHAIATPTIVFLFLGAVTALLLAVLCALRELGPGRTRLLADQYTKKLFSIGRREPMTLQHMHPRAFVTSTSLTTGQLVAFGGNQIRVYKADEPYDQLSNEEEFTSANLSGYLIGKAVCCSSAFPPAFSPVFLSKAELGQLQRGEGHYLTDGGIYDNLGIWLLGKLPAVDCVIVSDAGQPLAFVEDKSLGRFFERNVRANDISMCRVADYALSSAATGDDKNVAICRILFNKGENRHQALDDDVQLQLATLRTDLDRFSDDEVFCLVKHGAATAHMHVHRSGHVAGGPLQELTDDEIVATCGLTNADGHIEAFRRSHQPKARRWYTWIMWCLRQFLKCLVAPDWICIFWAVPMAALIAFCIYGMDAITATEVRYEGSFADFLAEWDAAKDKDAFIAGHTPRIVEWKGTVVEKTPDGCFMSPDPGGEARAIAHFRKNSRIDLDRVQEGGTISFRGHLKEVFSEKLIIRDCDNL
jgi:predicted acylesterase/phospholipase RssA